MATSLKVGENNKSARFCFDGGRWHNDSRMVNIQ